MVLLCANQGLRSDWLLKPQLGCEARGHQEIGGNHNHAALAMQAGACR